MHTRSILAFVALVSAPAAFAQSSSARQGAPAASVSRPYKADLPAALVRKARVAESAAAATALARVPGGRITSVELEEEDGKLIYSYDIAVAGRKGVEEVHVDAVTGTVIKSEHEGDSPEKAGKNADSTTKKVKAPSKRP